MQRIYCLIAIGFGTTVVATTLGLGATPAWMRFLLECIVVAGAIAWAASEEGQRRRLSVVLAVCALICLQTTPFPNPVLRGFAAGSSLAWKLAGEGTASSWHPISFSPHATLLSGCRLFLGVTTVIIASDIARLTTPRRLLQACLAISGLLIWGLGLAFPPQRGNTRRILGSVDLSGPIEFWLTPLKRPLETAAFGYRRVVSVGGDSYAVIDWGVGDGFGSYVISNHFAGALVMTLPIALGWLLFLTRDRFSTAARYAGVIAVLSGAAWTVGAMAGSRAGMGALLVAGTVFLACTTATTLWQRVAAGIAIACSMAVGGMAVVLYGGWQGMVAFVPPPLHGPLARLLTDSRAAATAIAKRLFWSSPWFGTGLGTYGDITAHIESNSVPWYFAHNEYAQWAAETGLVGIVGAVAVGIAILNRGVRFYRQPVDSERLLAAGAWGGLAGIAAHSLFDWNLHVPANAFLASLVAGLALSSVPATPAIAPLRLGRSTGLACVGRLVLKGVFSVCCLIAVGLLARDYQAAQTESQLRSALTAFRMTLSDPKKPSVVPQLEQAVLAGDRMAAIDPHNPQLLVLLGQANLILSMEPQPIDQANERRQVAEGCFQRARRSSAVCLGIPIGKSAF